MSEVLMATTDESNLLDHLSERINPNGWRVISNPTRQPDPQAEELKTLIQPMQARGRASGKLKPEETNPPETT